MTEINETAETSVFNPVKPSWIFLSCLIPIAAIVIKLTSDSVSVQESSMIMAILWSLLAGVLSYIGAVIGDTLRRIAMPDAYFSAGFWDSIGKRFFWAFGPQWIGWGCGIFLTLMIAGKI